MRSELVICDKKYTPAEFTFGTLAKLEDMGIDPLSIGEKPLKAIGAYVALTVGCNVNDAFKMIDEHISLGGDVDDISGAMAEALNESGFFQSLLRQKPSKKKKA